MLRWSAHYGSVQTSSDFQTITDLTIRVPSTSRPKCLSSILCCQLNLQLYRSRPGLKVDWSHLPFRQRLSGAVRMWALPTSCYQSSWWFYGFREDSYWSQELVKSTEVTCNKLHICLLHFPSKCQCLNCARSSARYATEVRCMRQHRSFVTLLQYSLLNYAL